MHHFNLSFLASSLTSFWDELSCRRSREPEADRRKAWRRSDVAAEDVRGFASDGSQPRPFRTTKGCESTLTDSVSTCTCCSSQFPWNGGSRSKLDHSSIHGAPQTRRASSSSGNSVPVSTERQSELVSASTGAGAAMSRPPDEEETKSKNTNDAFEIVVGDNEATVSDEWDAFYGLSRSVEDTMRALSVWRPFAWCEPR